MDIYRFFFVCVIFLSISHLWTAAWVTFNEASLQPVLLLASYSWNVSRVVNGHSIHILRIESFFLPPFLRVSYRVHSEARPFARHWSFAGERSCFVSKFFQLYVSIYCDGKLFFELAAGFDLAPFRKSVVHSSPRPRCLGWTFID